MFRGALAALAAGALVASSAGAACWSADEVAAAGVRELQSKLMVAALRCQAAGHPMLASYNAFVVANRAAIGTVNLRLKSHFIQASGPVKGQGDYDAFATSMANGYGGGASGAEACAAMQGLAQEAALMAGSVEGLLLIVQREGIAAKLPDAVCAAPAPLAIAAAVPAGATATVEVIEVASR